MRYFGLSVVPPWPPESWQAPQPYDQRGCCWPVGPCGYGQRLPMKLQCFASREGGAPIGFQWLNLADGITMVPERNTQTMLRFRPFGNDPFPPQSFLKIELNQATGFWDCQAIFYCMLVPPIYGTCIYNGVMTESACGSSFTLVHGVFGPIELALVPPDFLTFHWVDWWEDSFYPTGNWW